MHHGRMLTLFVIGGTLGSLAVCLFVLVVLIRTEPIVALVPVVTAVLTWAWMKRAPPGPRRRLRSDSPYRLS